MVRLAAAHGDVQVRMSRETPAWVNAITGGDGGGRYYRQGQYDFDQLAIRNLTQSDGFAERVVDALVLHAVSGTGIVVDFGNERVNKAFREWRWNSLKPGDKQIELQRSIVRGFVRDGEDFRVARFGFLKGKPNLFLDWYSSTLIDRNNGIWDGYRQGGIEFTADWTPYRYYMQATTMEAYYTPVISGVVDAALMVHTYRQDFDWQTRGISWLRPALKALRSLANYTDNVEEALDLMVRMPAWIQLTAEFSDYEEIGGLTPSQLLERTLKADPKRRSALPPGAELKNMDTPAMLSGVQVNEIVRVFKERIGRGTGVTTQTLSGATGEANMSEIRAGESQDQMVYQRAQQLLLQAVENVAGKWLDFMTILDPELVRGASEPTFTLPGPAFIDYRDRTADLQEIDKNTRSRSSAMRNRGDNPDVVWAEMEADARRVRRLNELMTGGQEDDVGSENRQPGSQAGGPEPAEEAD